MANTNTTSGYTEAFYNSYTSGYEHVLQEKKPAYMGLVREERIEGENESYDFLGTIELDEKVTRFEDIPIEDMTHNRRWITPSWYRKGIFVDKEDDIALHTDPTGDYIQALAKGAIRKENNIITAAFLQMLLAEKHPLLRRTLSMMLFSLTLVLAEEPLSMILTMRLLLAESQLALRLRS